MFKALGIGGKPKIAKESKPSFSVDDINDEIKDIMSHSSPSDSTRGDAKSLLKGLTAELESRFMREDAINWANIAKDARHYHSDKEYSVSFRVKHRVEPG